jgi:hypothetical protein
MTEAATDLRMRVDGRWDEIPARLPSALVLPTRAAPLVWPVRQIAGALAVVLVIGIFVGIVIFAYTQPTHIVTVDGVPLIRADHAVFRTKPAEPGGMVVPNQDRLVLQDLGRADAPVTIGRILPPPEVPLPRPDFSAIADAPVPRPAPLAIARLPDGTEILVPRLDRPAANDNDGGAVEVPAPIAGPVAATPPPDVAPTAPTAAADPAIAWSDPDSAAVAALEAEFGIPAADAAVTESPAVAPVAGGDTVVQVASVADEAEAVAEWARFQRRYPDLFGSLTLRIKHVSSNVRLGYRVQAEPLDRATGTRICQALLAEKTGCLVMAR